MLATRMRQAASGVSAGGGGWWEVSGKTCIGAWAGKGAASLAASYTDLSGNGNNLSAIVAPTWNSTAGWIFNGSTQCLDTGITPANDGYTYIVRHENANINSGLFGFLDASKRTYIQPYVNISFFRSAYANDDLSEAGTAVTTATADGVLAVTGDYGYYHDKSEDAVIGSWGAGTALSIYLGAIHRSGSITNYFGGNIQAFAIYTTTLSTAEIGDLIDVMNAL